MENIIGSNWRFQHIGAIVRDMDMALKYYASLGIFTIQPETPPAPGTPAIAVYEVYGKTPTTTSRAKLRNAYIGPHRFELISPTPGSPLFEEFLNKKGEGIHHIAFAVDDLDAEVEKLKAKGIPAVMRMKRTDGRGIAFFDLSQYGGVFIELTSMVAR
ncbi:MAG: VOC family protein [Chloroflexota bacterium]